MPLAELLDELFRLYRRHFSLIVGVSLLVVLPSLVWTLVTGTYRLSSGSYTTLLPTPGSTSPPSVTSADAQRLLGLLGLGFLGTIILLPFSVGAVYRAITDVSQGRPTTIAGVLREALGKYFPMLGLIALLYLALLVWFIALVIGFVLLILPGLAVMAAGVFFAIRWSLAVPAMMAEDIGPINSLRRSWNLVAGSWWRTFGILIVIVIMYLIVALALGIVFDVIIAIGLTGDARSAIGAIGSSVLGAIVSPIVAIGVVLLYFDLRTRKEGLDLDQLARDTTPGQAPA